MDTWEIIGITLGIIASIITIVEVIVRILKKVSIFKWVFSGIWKFICGICKWFKTIFTINKLDTKVNELDKKTEGLEKIINEKLNHSIIDYIFPAT